MREEVNEDGHLYNLFHIVWVLPVLLLIGSIVPGVLYGKGFPSISLSATEDPGSKIVAIIFTNMAIVTAFIGFLLCDFIYYRNAEYAIPFRWISWIWSLAIALSSWVTKNESNVCNAVCVFISVILFVVLAVFYYLGIKDSDTQLKPVLVVFMTITGVSIIVWIALFFVRDQPNMQTGYGITTYVMAVFMLGLLIFGGTKISKLAVFLVVQD